MTKKKYIIGNAKDVSAIVRKAKIPAPQLIISSPPYFDLLNYDNNKEQIGFGEKDYDKYLDTVCKVFQDCYDISSPDSTFWLIVDTFKKDKEVVLFPFDLANKLKAKNSKTWRLRDVIVWDKDKNLPWGGKGNFKNQHEYILFFSKSDKFTFNVDSVREITDLKKWWKTYPERYHPNGKAPSNVWNYITPIRGWGHNGQNHLCPLPFPLTEKIISIASNEGNWILDPFAGSGSLLAIASQMKRNSIGIDVNQEYKNIFENEVSESAEKYWKKRVNELKETKELIVDFKKVNQKLRKLKVARNICDYLNKNNKDQFVFYAKNKPENGIEIIVLQNGIIPNVDIKDEKLTELITKSDVDAKVVVKKELDFLQATGEGKSYKYKFKTFYSYTSSCKIKNVVKAEKRYEYLYSNIVSKISNE